MATNAVVPALTDEELAGLARFQTMLNTDGSIVPADAVQEWYLNRVQGQQLFCDGDNTSAVRLYASGSPLMPNPEDGLIGAWQGWYLSDYLPSTPQRRAESLARMPPPPFKEVVDLSGTWPARKMSTIPLCPQPQIPVKPTGTFIGAALANGWFAITLGDDNPSGTLVNFNGAVLQRVVYPFGGWWAPAPAGTSIAGLPIAQQAAPIPTGGAQ